MTSMARRSSVVTQSHLTSSPSGKVEAELTRLASADLNSLRRRWRTLFGGAPPALPLALLRRILAYRIQADLIGDLDPAVAKLLDRLGRGEVSEIPLPELRAIKPGTLLVREWDGAFQRVMVLESGFAWNGGTYESLSKVAMPAGSRIRARPTRASTQALSMRSPGRACRQSSPRTRTGTRLGRSRASTFWSAAFGTGAATR